MRGGYKASVKPKKADAIRQSKWDRGQLQSTLNKKHILQQKEKEFEAEMELRVRNISHVLRGLRCE